MNYYSKLNGKNPDKQIEKQIFFSKSNIINTNINVFKMKKQNLNYFTRAC